ncbi:hypothetical protein [Eleftheria terrae]|nr:hypothetical protein [Eleftheria terrae]WKB52614.1 hypothetical protein N7L95_22970 [Eleftheria terrae]
MQDRHPAPRWLRALAWALGLAVLLVVFAWYWQPVLVVELANQLWSCF